MVGLVRRKKFPIYKVYSRWIFFELFHSPLVFLQLKHHSGKYKYNIQWPSEQGYKILNTFSVIRYYLFWLILCLNHYSYCCIESNNAWKHEYKELNSNFSVKYVLQHPLNTPYPLPTRYYSVGTLRGSQHWLQQRVYTRIFVDS